MGISPVRFDGKDLFQPGYYGKRNISALDIGAATGSRLLIIGECKGGVPFNATTDYPNAEERINWISDSDTLNKLIRDGAAYYGALFALTPSNQPGVNGAPAVGVIRINKATKGSYTISDIDTDLVVDVKSKDYGLYTNQIRFKISDGTTKGKKISVKFEDQTVEGDNVTLELLKVQYVGAGTACALTIDPLGNLVTTVTGGPGGENISISLASYDTVASLVAYFNSLGVYSATLLGDGTFATNKLDKIISGDLVDIKTEYTVKAILQAVINWFNNSSSYLIASLTTGAERRVPANLANYVFLGGASDGASPVTQDWVDALNQICKVVDASFVGVMTNDLSVQTAISEHVTYMSSSVGRNERQSIVGSGSSDNKSTKLANAAILNNALVGYFGTEIKRYDKNGELQEWAGFYGAAEVLGMFAGNAINFAATNKMLNVVGIKEVYSNSDKDDYIKGGVMIAAPSSQGGIRVIRSVTTYQGSNIIANEFSAMRTALYVVKDHRTYVEALIGNPGDATGLESVKNRALLRLDYYIEQGLFVVDPALGNAYRNFTFTALADTITISYEATLVLPINFILVNHNFTVIGLRK